MKNSSALKNELIFQYASGTANLGKSLIASTYLFLNKEESSVYNKFINYCGEELKNVSQIKPKNLNAEQCISYQELEKKQKISSKINPFNILTNNFKNIPWKKVFNGFYEHKIKLSNNENAKLIKMDAGAKVPLHSHKGKEYILVLDGNFSDEYGTYSKGDLQINDSKIKHTPIACKKNGCVCLTVTENNINFYGSFAPILKFLTLIKSILFSFK